MSPCLSASNLACRRGDRLLFHGLNVSLDSGDALEVAGPNGSGKTSLLRILGQLLKPANGVVKSKGAIGLVDNRNALDPDLPLAQALRFWSEIDKAGPTLLEERIERLGLAELQDIPVRYLSHGQRKRAALVRLLTQRPGIWLLDEPLNGLDASGVDLVHQILAEHCTGGGIALIASHQAITFPQVQRLDLPDYSA